MNWLKQRDFQLFELGVQHFGSQLHSNPTAKDISISLFKRGFGGHIVPYFRGEKYYDKEFFKRVFDDRLNSYLNSWGE